jgi:hypothetical protein
MIHAPLKGFVLACALLAGCEKDIFYEPSAAERAACMKSRPNDAEAHSNCYYILVYEHRSKGASRGSSGN